MTGKRLMSLKEKNNKSYRYISELNQEVLHLKIELFEKERRIKDKLSICIERVEDKWKDKEAEQIKQSNKYEAKFELIETALEDYDLQIKQTNGGFLLTDLLYNGEDEE